MFDLVAGHQASGKESLRNACTKKLVDNRNVRNSCSGDGWPKIRGLESVTYPYPLRVDDSTYYFSGYQRVNQMVMGPKGPEGCVVSAPFLLILQVWQVQIINTQRFEKYFVLMRRKLGEFSGIIALTHMRGAGNPRSWDFQKEG